MTRSGRRRLVHALGASAVALLTCASHASAQDEPVVVGARRKLPTFGIEPPHGTLNFYGSYSRDQVTSGSAQDTTTTQWRFEESITLQTQAYVVHPNFLNIDLQGQFGLTQERFSATGEPDDDVFGTLYLWNVNATFFRENPTNFSLYTNRTENIVDRAFAESFRNIYTTYGAFLSTRQGDTLNTFRLYRTEQEQKSLGSGDNDFKITDNIFEWHSELKPARNQYLTFDYQFDQTEQSSAGGVDDDSTSHSASVAHTLSFGQFDQHTLGSSLAYSNSSGNFGIEQIHLDELLRLRHTRNFETEYEYIYDQQNSDTIDQTLQRATAEFRHRLYQSLVTHGEVGLLNLETGDGGSTTDWFVQIDAQYTKKVPYGRIDSNLFAGYNSRSITSGGDPVPVVDQPFTFVGFQPIFIPGQTVNASTIEITDSATGRIYQEGIDYTLLQRPSGVQVDRVVGGAIPSDSTVLVDYTLNPLPDTDIQSTAFSISLRYDILEGPLTGFSPYARFSMIDQSVSGGGGFIQPDSVRDYLAGLEYRWRGLTVRGEYEIYDSDLAPFDAARFYARYDYRGSYDTVVSANASYIFTDYTEQDQQNTTINAGVTATHRFTRRLLASGSVNYVHIDDSIGGQTTGLQESIELRWRNRQFEIYGRFRNSNLDSDDQETNFQLFEMGIAREF
jgi:hypothetical protein